MESPSEQDCQLQVISCPFTGCQENPDLLKFMDHANHSHSGDFHQGAIILPQALSFINKF
jgi:hypothetical protein